jgi:hypothetical protein
MGAVKLSISVKDIENVIQSFNTIRVWRSTTGDTGVYSALTANISEHAKLPAGTSPSYDVSGKTLKFQVDSHPFDTVLFTGLAPLSLAQVVNQINAVRGGIASDVADKLMLTSPTYGTASKLKLDTCSAAIVFGWTGSERLIGLDSHVVLVPGSGVYEYTDNDGEPGYYYKVQYYNTINGLASNLSSAFQGAVATLISPSKLSVANIDLVDAQGIAIPGQQFTFYSVHEPLKIEGFQVALTRAPITTETDNSGHAEVTLVRGLKVKVVIEGTSLIREITVPNEDSFDLLTLMGEAPDPFSVLNPSFPYAIRRTI